MWADIGEADTGKADIGKAGTDEAGHTYPGLEALSDGHHSLSESLGKQRQVSTSSCIITFLCQLFSTLLIHFVSVYVSVYNITGITEYITLCNVYL